MLKSMTGFARAERTTPAGLLAWEIRSVNHRYLEVGLRLPEELRALESEFRRAIGIAARRGKVDASFYVRPGAAAGRELALDSDLLDALIERAGAVAGASAPKGASTPSTCCAGRGLCEKLSATRPGSPRPASELLAEALTAFTASRASEGERIAEMLRSRAAQVTAIIGAIGARLPEVQARIRAKMQERLAALGAEVNPERLEQEVALLLQKMDVAEELDRLGSHVDELTATIASGDAVGRKLDFLMQEFNREANTLSSKSQDVETTRQAVELKVLIEQMREQVQNVE